jgi:hypothetical protein
MKRVVIFAALALVCAGIGRAAYQAAQLPRAPISKYVPAGALLYLEAQDFSSLLEDWNASPEKKQWLATGNYEVFSRSRLFLRLKGASDQFAAAAGFPPNMNFVSQVAGTRSALALYDIGNLEFLYVTYLPSAKSMQTTLWETRAKFEPRSAGGVTFYVRRDPESQREIAFAVSGDYLLLATRTDILAGALQSMSEDATRSRTEIRTGEARTIESEPWWAQSVASAGPAGDLRMVMNLEKIVPSPYFRTYWVQQNITDMKQYSAAVSDLFRSSKEFREERILFRKTPAAPTPAEGLDAAADLVRLVPETAGVYEAKANPSADSCFNLIETKLLAPHLGPAPASETAPRVQLTSGETGSGSDLETRIDRATVERPAALQSTSALKDVFDETQILASLEIQTTQIQTTQARSPQSQSTERDQSRVFVRIHSAIVLTAASDWSEATVQSALADFVRPGLTASGYGVAWQQKFAYAELDGLWPLAMSVRGKYLLVSDDPGLLEAILANFNRKPNLKGAVFVGGFNHEREQSNFARFAALVDRPSVAQFNGGANANTDASANDRQPPFFAENMASLSRTLAGVSAERIMMRLEGDKVLQTVTYVWSR